MKRLTLIVMAGMLTLVVGVAYAGDYHTTGKLKCGQCHTMHASQSHEYVTGGAESEPIVGGPYPNLLRNKVNDLCLACHDQRLGGHNSDVFCDNTDGEVRQGGALNIADGAISGWTNTTGYDQNDGHSLYSTATAPGGTWNNPDGLECTDCHMPHGHVPTQYRNLWSSTTTTDKFYNKTITYSNTATRDPSVDVSETGSLAHATSNVWFNEPDPHRSAYADWCQSCHTHFHGTAGDVTTVGGQAGGWTFASQVSWVRHPNADVDIGHEPSADFVSSYTRYSSLTNKVKVMLGGTETFADLQAGTVDPTATPSCFSCHKGHGNQNPFGLIMMAGTGAVTEQGDEAGMDPVTGAYAGAHPNVPTPLCNQCHIQGL